MKFFYKFSAVILTLIMASTAFMPFLTFADETEESEEEVPEDFAVTSTTTEVADGGANYGGYFACQLGVGSGGTEILILDDRTPDDDRNEENARIEAMMEEFEAEFAHELSLLDENSNYCGNTVNPVTGSLEQADCVAEGKVVTEISEVFAGTTKLGDEARISTVYKTNCCMVLTRITVDEDKEPVYSCRDSRSVYFTSRDECNSAYPEAKCQRRQWIIGDSGASIIKIYIKQIYIWAAGAIGLISVIVIVLNGIRITVSGVTGDITQAKDRIFQSLTGLILLFLSGLILYTINPGFFT